MDLANELEAYLHLHIPISGAMGVSVLDASEEGIRLRIPLEPNINHRQTAFGGSESSAAILSAWSLLWVRLRGHPLMPRLVIQANTMEYVRPISSEFVAATLPIAPDDWRKLLAGLERKGKGRIQVRAVLLADGEVCGEFTGAFAALAV